MNQTNRSSIKQSLFSSKWRRGSESYLAYTIILGELYFLWIMSIFVFMSRTRNDWVSGFTGIVILWSRLVCGVIIDRIRITNFIKRFHDMGKRWRQARFSIIPGAMSKTWLYLMFASGNTWDNEYGPEEQNRLNSKTRIITMISIVLIWVLGFFLIGIGLGFM